ncbi:hypothetical protein GF339_08705 [candidate division KSB3 bacterium]|uniref:Uncharacterized protein n=1 Tax=candidate division KSB3 bacterium TaxID=2044937 RepID=A0A9D5JUZ4_9BACT|nr:hypothetical protein [candidate division KSB3 bacterium]MBD3324650.1 hypothetical protein [candidate division KSB3 bacterium]
MRAFLTGKRGDEWRWDIGNFLTDQDIEFVDPAEDLCSSAASLFKQFKLLEGCDLLIAYFAGLRTHPLISVLEMEYASRLAKDVMVVGNLPQDRQWTRSFPYSLSFPDLEGLKAHLTTRFHSPGKHLRLIG